MFKITQRQYDIIIKQVQTNYPFESGGFIGGTDFIIKAILPIFNKDESNKQDVFGLNHDDLNRAYQFFSKHQLDYYGIYHSHPKGPAIPSEQDLKHIQRYLFIISLMNFDTPDFAAYKVTGIQQAKRVPLTIVSNDAVTSSVKTSGLVHFEGRHSGQYLDEATRDLNQKIHNVFNNSSQYDRYIRQDDSGHFSTLA